MQNYDYIVIGSGSAGSIVAGRLAANPELSVLLLEAGGEASAYPKIWDPNQINCLYDIPQIHWGYKSLPQVHMNNRIMDVWRAKMTGGCTAHNDMVYVRGAPADFDQWEIDYGCIGWRYKDIAQNFARVEAVMQPTTTTKNAFGAAFVEACEKLGYTYNPDYNSGANMFGVSPLRSTISKTFRRQTSYERYVIPLLATQKNLSVITNALVGHIEFDNKKRARSVVFSIGGVAQRATAEKEIVLSAGAINSPQILMRSGIGDANVLRKLGAQVVMDLPGVGANLMDALIFQGTWSSSQPITNQPVNEGYAIVWANMNAQGQASNAVEMMRGKYTCGQSEAELQGFYSVTGDMMRLQSRGAVTLRSLNPADAPLIDMNFLSHPDDYAECVKGFELMRSIGNAPGLAAWRGKELTPGPTVVTPAEIKSWILNNAWSLSHPVGTCRMGIGETAVVDAQLRVYGVSGLRVIDASIMPRITSGHTQGPSLMIGDKGASMILAGP
ncbi:GMC family oxidoreductase [Dyella silvatica]|uniref:GMC family oxidoreductase n=1 Tax=Dyella silvatica TaxID=2992128 RepID=UPI0022501C58|nr:GMC oxidoreductase [Dyella silvatica]